MKNFILIILCLTSITLFSQVGIGTSNPNEGSILHIEGEGSILLPRVALSSPTSTQIIPVGSLDTLEEGMLLYNTNGDLSQMPDGKGIYYWNGSIWVKFKAGGGTSQSLWYKTGTATLASSTTDQITRTAEVTLGNNINQPGAILNLESKDKGLLLNRVTLVDINSPQPILAAGSTMSEGMFVYNIGDSSDPTYNIETGVYYWDGAKWNRLFVNTSTNAGNDGVVKINSGNGAAQTQPVLNLTKSGNEFGPFHDVEYLPSLNYATASTNWPENILNPQDSDIYNFTTNRFLENTVDGQVHMWRVILGLAPSNSSAGSISGKIYNPDSGFETTSVQLIPGGNNQATASFIFFTIADSSSIGSGYKIAFSANNNISVYVKSIARVSLFKD